VDIPENSKRIGEARAMGDLSENAEYDAAKEEQARLASRASELEHLLRYARVLKPEEVKTDRIGPGTRARIRYENGDVEQYTLLGVWDANPEKHILSYKSPLGSQFLGKKKGDMLTIDLPSGEQRRGWIDNIENGLTPDGDGAANQ
jgi:transcription elongation factor GreA